MASPKVSTRQSSRKKPVVLVENLGPNDDTDAVEEEYTAGSSKKRQKRSANTTSEPQKTRPRKAGKLQSLPEMPLDILYEIFSNLKPLDLLRLSRTTHALRNLLTRRSTISIWKEARENVDNLPELPSDLNEIQYADLLFVARCHQCGSSHSTKEVYWTARVRLCRSCFDKIFVDYYELTYGDRRSPPFFLRELVPSVSRQVGTGRRGRFRYLLCHSRLHYEQLMQEYEQVKGSTKVDAWVDEKRTRMKEVTAHGKECQRWYQEQTTNRTNDLSDLRANRKASILDRLRDLGWGLEIDKLTVDQQREFSKHSMVNQPKDLTARIWSNISSAMLALFETFKADRLLRDRYALIKSRQSVVEKLLDAHRSAHPDEVVPALADVCYFPAIRALIETPLPDEPDKDLLEESMKDLPDQIKAWRADRDQELLRIIAEDTGTPLANLSQLQLATTWFIHKNQLSMSYPPVLVHRYAGRIDSYAFDQKAIVDVQLQPRSTILEYSPWNYKSGLAFDQSAHRNTIKVLETCELDIASTTADALDVLDPWFECCTCETTHYRLVMPWRTAAIHRCVLGVCQPGFVRCSPEDVVLATTSAQYPDPLQSWFYHYRCGHCTHRGQAHHLRIHLAEMHNVATPVIKVDYHTLLEYPVHQPHIRLPKADGDIPSSPASDSYDYYD